MTETSETVTGWLAPHQPLALWWARNYPELRAISRNLAALVLAAPGATQPAGINPNEEPSSAAIPRIPVDTEDLRYYDYGLLGGAIDYRMRMEFSGQWGGDPARSTFTRAWAGKRGSLAHAAAGLLADCAPSMAAVPRASHLGESLPALTRLLEESATRLDALAPWDWTGPYATSQREEPWLLDYCILLAELDNFHRSWGTSLDFMPLLSGPGYRSAMYASGRPVKPAFRGPDYSGAVRDSAVGRSGAQEVATRIVGEMQRSWPLFAYLCNVPTPVLEDMAAIVARGGRAGKSERLPLLRRDLSAQVALWHLNPARRRSKPPRVIAANPTFAGSTRLPADGDLIVRDKGGTGYLIDFKSAKRIKPASMLAVLRQILTYALMDESDEYQIRRVGFYFTRYGTWAYWDLRDLLDTGMGGGSTAHSKTLESHRQALRKMLLDLRQPEVLGVALPRRRR